jgi:hydroxyacylglutathione hydrolase
MLDIIAIPARTDNYIYLLHDEFTGQTAVVDPADAEPVMRVLLEKGWSLDYIFNTHHHADHVDGNLALKQYTACKIVASYFDRHRIPGIDIAVAEGEQITLGGYSWQILQTPGHTLGHIVFYSADTQTLFSGDTLFSMGCGRLFEGSAEQMWHSLQVLKNLPRYTRVYCAHEYTQGNARFAASLEADNMILQQRIQEVEQLRNANLPTLPTTIGLEIDTNPFFRETSPSIRRVLNLATDTGSIDAFTAIRRKKDNFQ